MKSISSFLYQKIIIFENLISETPKYKLYAAGKSGSTKQITFVLTDAKDNYIAHAGNRNTLFKNAKLKESDINELNSPKNHKVFVRTSENSGVSVDYSIFPVIGNDAGSHAKGYNMRRRWFGNKEEADKFAKSVGGKITTSTW